MDIRHLSIELQNQILDLYINQGVKPSSIAKLMGFKYHQPIYTFLQKNGVFKKHSTGSNSKRTYNVDETFFDVIDTEEKAYILGFIVADGYVDEKRNCLVISLNRQDRDILDKICSSLKSNHQIKSLLKDGKYHHVLLQIGSKKLVTNLVNKGVYAAKSLTMTGDVIYHVKKEFRRDFLRGYFDGDGCIHYGRIYSSGTKFSLTVVGTKDFLEKTFNTYCDTNCKIFKYKSCNMYGWAVAAKSKVDKCLDYLYKDSVIHLDRKYELYLQSKKYHKECAHVKPEELLETQLGQSAAEPGIQEGSETIEKQSKD